MSFLFLSNIIKNSFYNGDSCSLDYLNKVFWAFGSIGLKERMSWLGYGQDMLPSAERGRVETHLFTVY